MIVAGRHFTEGCRRVDRQPSGRLTFRVVTQVLYSTVRRAGYDVWGSRGERGDVDGWDAMSVRSAVLRSLLVVVASSFGAAARVGAVADRTGEGETDAGVTVTPPGPLGPAASAGRQAIVTGVGPGPESGSDD